MKISGFFVVLFVMFLSVAQATQQYEETCWNSLIILVEEGDSSIAEYSEGKLSFNPSRLLFSPDGMFVRTDSGVLYPIARLSFDPVSGYFQPVLVKCPKCGCVFEKGPLHCPSCGALTY